MEIVEAFTTKNKCCCAVTKNGREINARLRA